MRNVSASYASKSIGKPTEMFERIVESNETIVHFVASISDVRRLTTRSITGFPYFDSPI